MYVGAFAYCLAPVSFAIEVQTWNPPHFLSGWGQRKFRNAADSWNAATELA